MHDRFATVANHVVAALASLGVSASVGELDREYCPGNYSVHIKGAGKIMGSGQRLARRASQVAGMIVVRDADVINEVLVPVYATLGLDMDPARTGAITTAAALDASTVARSFARQFAQGRDAEQADIDDPTMALARELQSDHDPRVLA